MKIRLNRELYNKKGSKMKTKMPKCITIPTCDCPIDRKLRKRLDSIKNRNEIKQTADTLRRMINYCFENKVKL